jgi:hypothetical protein
MKDYMSHTCATPDSSIDQLSPGGWNINRCCGREDVGSVDNVYPANVRRTGFEYADSQGFDLERNLCPRGNGEVQVT